MRRTPGEISKLDIINNLPPELLVNIFSYFYWIWKKKAFDTSQVWNNIRNIPQLWLFRRIVLFGIRGEVDQIFQSLKDFGDNIKHLSIEIIDNEDFGDNIKHLSIEIVDNNNNKSRRFNCICYDTLMLFM